MEKWYDHQTRRETPLRDWQLLGERESQEFVSETASVLVHVKPLLLRYMQREYVEFFLGLDNSFSSGLSLRMFKVQLSENFRELSICCSCLFIGINNMITQSMKIPQQPPWTTTSDTTMKAFVARFLLVVSPSEWKFFELFHEWNLLFNLLPSFKTWYTDHCRMIMITPRVMISMFHAPWAVGGTPAKQVR